MTTWTWEQLWEFRASLANPELRDRLDREVGFIRLNGQLHVTQAYDRYLSACSIPTLKARLKGAPAYLIWAYGQRLSRQAVLKLMDGAQYDEPGIDPGALSAGTEAGRAAVPDLP